MQTDKHELYVSRFIDGIFCTYELYIIYVALFCYSRSPNQVYLEKNEMPGKDALEQLTTDQKVQKLAELKAKEKKILTLFPAITEQSELLNLAIRDKPNRKELESLSKSKKLSTKDKKTLSDSFAAQDRLITNRRDILEKLQNLQEQLRRLRDEEIKPLENMLSDTHALDAYKTKEKSIESEIKTVHDEGVKLLNEASNECNVYKGLLDSKKSESSTIPWFRLDRHFKNYQERWSIRSFIAHKEKEIDKIIYDTNTKIYNLETEKVVLRDKYIKPLEQMSATHPPTMHSRYKPDKDPEKQKTANSIFKKGEILFKTFYDKGFEIYKERVANEKAGLPRKTMTPEEKLIASTRDLIGAALSHLKYPSNLTRETLERRHEGYNEALQNTDLSKDDDVLPKLNEFLWGVKSLDPNLNLPIIENKTMPTESMTTAPPVDNTEALITRLAIVVKNGEGNTSTEPVNSKSAGSLTDSEKVKQDITLYQTREHKPTNKAVMKALQAYIDGPHTEQTWQQVEEVLPARKSKYFKGYVSSSEVTKIVGRVKDAFPPGKFSDVCEELKSKQKNNPDSPRSVTSEHVVSHKDKTTRSMGY